MSSSFVPRTVSTFLVFILLLKIITANSPRIWGVSDHFVMVNDQEIYQQATDDRGEWHSSRADVNRLRLLGNDVVFGLPDKFKTCVMKTQGPSTSRPSNDNKHDRNWFEDVHRVGFYIQIKFSTHLIDLFTRERFS